MRYLLSECAYFGAIPGLVLGSFYRNSLNTRVFNVQSVGSIALRWANAGVIEDSKTRDSPQKNGAWSLGGQGDLDQDRLMAFRLNEDSIQRGLIDNREKGRTRVRLEFTDGFTMSLDLKGNPYRDLGGCLLSLENPEADSSANHDESLVPLDSGVTGDITAARKVRHPLVPIDEFIRARKRGESPPEEWRNSLYLEWYSLERGRCVLEAVNLQMTLGEPAWEMTEEDGEEAKADAARALGGFMERLEGQVESVDKIADKDDLDEFEWEKIFRHSDNTTDRYMELLDKFDDEKDHDLIDEQMGWTRKNDDEGPKFEIEVPDDLEFEEWIEPEPHPIAVECQEVLDSLDRKIRSESEEQQMLFFAVANVRAKISGAMSQYEGAGIFGDNGFVVAYLKRVLVLIDEAVSKANDTDPSVTPRLLRLRTSVIDLQQDLRGRMS